ncbi:MAG TPA: hypothetical protein PKM88_12115, partial [bacterium]|nr:hypothetical protein [bacterium]
ERLRIALAPLLQRASRFRKVIVREIDISPLLQAQADAEAENGSEALPLTERAMVRGLRRRGWKVERLIYPFENQPWERMLLTSMRSTYPDCAMVGYQHSVVSPRYLFYRSEASESAYMPQPDSIVTSGFAAAALLSHYGYRSRIIVGCGLRYAPSGPAAALVGKVRRIVVALPIYAGEADELIDALHGLAGTAGCKLTVVPHPCQLPGAATRERLAALGVEFSTLPLAVVLQRGDVLVYGNSAACLDGLAAGCALVYFRARYGYNYDPLDGRDAVRRAVTTLDAGILQVLPPSDPAAILAEFVSPVTSEACAVFFADRQQAEHA